MLVYFSLVYIGYLSWVSIQARDNFGSGTTNLAINHIVRDLVRFSLTADDMEPCFYLDGSISSLGVRGWIGLVGPDVVHCVEEGRGWMLGAADTALLLRC